MLLSGEIDKLRTAIQTYKAHPQDIWGLATGFAPLDAMLGGLHETDLAIVAGRPSMGKTALGMQIVLGAAQEFKATGDGEIVYVGSAEMKTARVLLRWVGGLTRINPERIKKGMISEAELREIEAALSYLEGLPIFVNDTYGFPIALMVEEIARLEAAQNVHVGLAAYDYLQLASGFGRDAFERAGAAARGLKQLAREHEIPVLALSQLNREVEKRGEQEHGRRETAKVPTLADLKNSSDIEDVSDVVMLLHRPNYYAMLEEGRDAEIGDAQIIVAKNRDGQTGRLNVRFDPVLTTFLPAVGNE